MATLTRTNSGVNPTYKDYVNFLGGYKSGKKDNENYPLTTSTSNSSTSSSLSSSDVTDFAKQSCISYNSFLENSKNKKFSSVKPKLEEKTTMKSEIFIEIQEPQKSVSEVSKLFEKKTPVIRSNSINSKISMFEKQISVEKKPKISEKPTIKSPSKPNFVRENGLPPKPPSFQTQNGLQVKPAEPQILASRENSLPAKPPSFEPQFSTTVNGVPPPPPPPLPSMHKPTNQNGHVPPPPPMAANSQNQKAASLQPPKLQATLKTGPQTKFTVNNPNGVAPNGIDRNDPMVKKLVYGTLRGLYGAYHDKASDMLATLPRNMVVRSNGVQDRIEQIAANGDLDKLNGRVNPKLEE